MRGEMATLLQIFSPSLSSSSSPTLIPFPFTVTAAPISMLQRKSLYLQPKAFSALRVCMRFSIQERGAFIVRASSDIDGTGGASAGPPPELKEEVVPVENLPLESKQQLMLEQKLRMKLAKKIRLRRKRLVRKRRMRKKGRWPPSKMKKNKNV
ncbi:hypothetical protein AQUCO_00900048v1 [Aquilegia coerulea]|uniref:50S ribosomal protein 5, chloroplastic n=1 Tax=Aquilegia coerulea TaxID=218851 RepID=A0A2G5EBN1_AQUCA|nr:hypothetical protein AQUCO_00900048v1 [Aquilegia coerulea]